MKKFFSKCVATVKNDNFIGKQFMVQGETIQATSQIAQGSFAFVYETTSPNYVIKHMKVQTKEQLQEVFEEIRYQQLVSYHLNTAKIYASYLNNQQLQTTAKFEQYASFQLPCECNLILERCETSVLTIINKLAGFLQEDQVIQVFAGAVAGFTAQHNAGITNRDGKIENLLFKRESNPFTYKNVRICDFGSCTFQTFTNPMAMIKNSHLRAKIENEISNKTTPQYRAPEMIDLYARMPITNKSDVFALGVMLYRLMYKVLPFPEGEILANFNIRYQFPDETEEFKKRSKYDEKGDVPIYSDFLKNLVKMCLVKDPTKRASVYELAALLETKIGKFGNEEQKEITTVEDPTVKYEEERSQSVKVQGGISNMFDWVPVAGAPAVQSSVQQQPSMQQQRVNSMPQFPRDCSSAPLDNSETSIIRQTPIDAQPASVAQIPPNQAMGKIDLFGLSEETTPQKAAPSLLDFVPAQPAVEQQQLVTQQQTQPQQQQQSIDDLLDFSAPAAVLSPVVVEAPLQIAPQVHPQANNQPLVQTAHHQQPTTQQPQKIYEEELKQLKYINTQKSELSADFLVQNTRRIGCGIFSSVNLTDVKLAERYNALIFAVKQCLLGALSAEQISQLDSNFQMLVQSTQQSQNPKKEQILSVLRDLFTLEQIAVQYAKLREVGEFDGLIQLNAQQAKQHIQAICKLLQLLAGLCSLAQRSPHLGKYSEELAVLVVKPILKTCKNLSDYSSGLDPAAQQLIKHAYQALPQHKQAFGVQLPEILDLGDF